MTLYKREALRERGLKPGDIVLQADVEFVKKRVQEMMDANMNLVKNKGAFPNNQAEKDEFGVEDDEEDDEF